MSNPWGLKEGGGAFCCGPNSPTGEPYESFEAEYSDPGTAWNLLTKEITRYIDQVARSVEPIARDEDMTLYWRVRPEIQVSSDLTSFRAYARLLVTTRAP